MHNINIKPEALKHLRHTMTQSKPGTLGIRLGLRDAGCAGYAYVVDFATQHNPEDHVLAFEDLNIFIADEYFKALQGMEIDYIKKGVNYSLEFINPNVVDQCGCGESFKFKDEED